MSFCTSVTSYEKVPNMEVMHILTTYNIDFGVVFIRGRMQLVEPKYCGRLTLDMVCPRTRAKGCWAAIPQTPFAFGSEQSGKTKNVSNLLPTEFEGSR